MKMEQKALESAKSFIMKTIPLRDEEWEAGIALLKPITLKKGEFFNHYREQDVRIGIILKGLLRTFFHSESGDEYTTDFCSEYTVTANYEIFAGNRHGDYCTMALEKTTILQMTWNEFLALCRQYPVWEIFKQKQLELYYAAKIQREKELLSLSAEQKYLQFLEKYKSFAGRLRQVHIASYLGIKPETLSRIIAVQNK